MQIPTQEVANMQSVTVWVDIPVTAVIPKMTIIPNAEWVEVIQEMKHPTTLCVSLAL
jgi:hypothetical protein